MAKNPGQKLKLLYLAEYLLAQTDDKHGVTMNNIVEYLADKGISAERKSIYNDLEALKNYGLDIETDRGKTTYYYVACRRFQLPELKLLVDAVQGSKFITHKKSNELIKKMESLASVHEAQQLQRYVYVANRIKTMNESIYYNVDTLHEAIFANKQISFLYYEWQVDFSKRKKIVRRARKNGKRYQVSPWALNWDDENYYLLAYDAEAEIIKHFRVDKMENIVIEDDCRQGKETFADFDMAVYSKKIFGMFGGREEMVEIVFDNSLIGVVVDRFGSDIYISPQSEDCFKAAVKVMVSPQFLGWLMSFGGGAKLVGPPWVCEKFQNHLAEIAQKYQ